MIRFKQFIEESSLPKNVKLSDVSGDRLSKSTGLPDLLKKEIDFWEKYISILNDWIEEGFVAIGLDFLLKSMNKISNEFRKSGTFYRGLNLTDFDMKDVLDSNLIELNKMESWSKIESIGRKFAIEGLQSGTSKKGIGILITKKISSDSVVLDIEKFITNRKIIEIAAKVLGETFDFSSYKNAIKEQEIIIAGKKIKNIKLNSKELKYFLKGKEVSLDEIRKMI